MALMHECDGCGEIWLDADVVSPVPHLEERVGPGERMPSGCCPGCGGLTHEIEEEEESMDTEIKEWLEGVEEKRAVERKEHQDVRTQIAQEIRKVIKRVESEFIDDGEVEYATQEEMREFDRHAAYLNGLRDALQRVTGTRS